MEAQFSEAYRQHINMKNPLWRLIRAMVFMFSFGRDCVNPFLKAQQVDHLRYGVLKRTVRIEIPLIDVVPLHASTHRFVTRMRDNGYAAPVNAVLRVGYGFWIALWLYSVLLIGQFFGAWHFVPTPFTIVNAFQSIYHGLARV